METFMKTYTKERTLFGLAFSRCEGMSEVGKFVGSVYGR